MATPEQLQQAYEQAVAAARRVVGACEEVVAILEDRDDPIRQCLRLRRDLARAQRAAAGWRGRALAVATEDDLRCPGCQDCNPGATILTGLCGGSQWIATTGQEVGHA